MPSIADAPIDWTRNADLQEVPPLRSVNTAIQNRWAEINKAIFDGTPVEHAIAGAEEELVQVEMLIASGRLDPSFDWKHDFELARFSHRFHMNNIEFVRNKRTSYLEYWRNNSKDALNFFREVSLNGQKMIYLVHGAVALGALNILTKEPKPSAGLLLTAKCAVAFASLGIILVGAGQLIMFYFGSILAGRIGGKLIGDAKWSKARAVPRYIRRKGHLVTWGDRAVYASVFWCGIYLVLLLVLLMSN